MKQQSLATLAYAGMKKRTRREKFLQEMKQVVPWERFEGLIGPYYPKVGKGRLPKGLRVMLRIYCLQRRDSCARNAPNQPKWLELESNIER